MWAGSGTIAGLRSPTVLSSGATELTGRSGLDWESGAAGGWGGEMGSSGGAQVGSFSSGWTSEMGLVII